MRNNYHRIDPKAPNVALQLRRASKFKFEEHGLLEEDALAPSAASAC